MARGERGMIGRLIGRRRVLRLGLALGALAPWAALGAPGCAGPAPGPAGAGEPDGALPDIDRLTDLPRADVVRVVRDWRRADEVLISLGVIEAAHGRLVKALIAELLADLTLFSAGATERPRNVRVVILGRGAPDLVVSQRALGLYRTLAAALDAGALPRRAVTDLVLLSQLAGAVTRALDAGKRIDGGVFTTVLQGLAHDGREVLETDV